MSGLKSQSFARKWQDSELKERSGSHEHFIDLCRMLGHGTPAQLDPRGDFFTFEKGATKHGGGDGWADVWYKGHFAWEYKGKHANLEAAYSQLLKYREYLESPPLLIVSDMDRFEVHCNFTGSARREYHFDLQSLADVTAVEVVPSVQGFHPPTAIEVLHAAFIDPFALRPSEAADTVTKNVAAEIGRLADLLRQRGIDEHKAAHFLMKVMFCFFAEDVHLLPKKIFTVILDKTSEDPNLFVRYAGELFEAMAHGGHVLLEKIPHFDGGLFADSELIRLLPHEIDILHRAGDRHWEYIDPAIFGTLFERCIDPKKHDQIGRHYTYADDIAAIVEPVLVEPLQKEWENITNQIAKIEKTGKDAAKVEKMLRAFQDRLASVRVLDPACGSGNFLYVALRRLLDLEKKVVNFAFRRGIELTFKVRPTQLHGMEISPFAHELASVVVWIGYLQWMRDNGAPEPKEPILEPIETIHLMDAIVGGTGFQPVQQKHKARKGTGYKPVPPQELDWPDADFIIGNPPFLGGKKLRTDLSDEYVDGMFRVWSAHVPRESDLCCYWFEKARAYIDAEAKKKHYVRAGLLATQAIRGGANRTVLQRIKESGDIFMAWSDRKWFQDGVAVQVSMIGFDDGTQKTRTLD
ncbi:MAG: type IIL restriction-modification enzyme MmeI, partial [Planctomycetota bacterium]|nr:type IIL restriction-modification enzyme MmeI [Planctomycetota bacterium]